MNIVAVAKGIETLTEDLGEIGGRLEHDQAAMEAIGVIGLRRSQISFEAQGWDGVTWDVIKPQTEQRRRNEDKGSIQILRDTGALMQSLAKKGDFNVWALGDHFVRWGSNRPGAEAHNDGYPAGGIPKRQFAGWTDQDLRDYQETYLDYALGFGEGGIIIAP